MTTTDELIRRLAADASPLRPGAAWRRLAAGLGLGAAASLAVISLWLGAPFQAAEATAIIRKVGFPMPLLIIAFVLLLRAGRPGRELGLRWLWLLVPPAVVAIGAAMELLTSTPDGRSEILFGSTWQRCLIAIPLLSLPILAGVLWAFRRFAPTRLHVAGLLAGITAGAASAILYALYCPETTKTFLVSWYSLGILVPGLGGLAAGRTLLRW